MTTVTSQPPIGRLRPATQHDPHDAGFFAYHGIWAPGVRLFRNLTFTSKALLVSTAFVLPTLCLLAWFLVSQAEHDMGARMEATRQHVEIALGAVELAHSKEVSGALSRDAAQKLAKETLATMRYNKTDYFFIFDLQTVMLMHPIKPELVGTDVGALKDSNGTAMWTAMADVVRQQDKGFVNYLWPKPGSDMPVGKVSFAQGFKPWGWVVGSGVYVDDLRAVIRQRLLLASGVFAATLLLASYFFYCFYRVMDGGLKETRRHLRAMTAGDLTTSPSPWGADEAAQLMLDLRTMQDSLRNIVTNVRGSSESIVTASSEIASASLDLSARTEETAANLEKSASSMEEISTTVKNTADNVKDAAQLASENSQAAARGGAVIADVVSTMDDINASSKRIADIIGVIDSIAFQTNILALNAAVEAARAGEQGRGFAVVATEVRSLAQRSAQAAKEIKTLISTSVEKVESGAKIVKGAGDTMQELVSNAGRMNDLLSQVSTAATQQSAGVSQVGEAVNELDRMTQQNAALVEQTAAAASALKDQAIGLAKEVDRFKMPVGN